MIKPATMPAMTPRDCQTLCSNPTPATLAAAPGCAVGLTAPEMAAASAAGVPAVGTPGVTAVVGAAVLAAVALTAWFRGGVADATGAAAVVAP